MNRRSLYVAHRLAGAGVRESARKAGYACGIPTQPARQLEEHARAALAQRDTHLGKPASAKMHLNAAQVEYLAAKEKRDAAQLNYEAALAVYGGLI